MPKTALGELETDGDLNAAYGPAFLADEAHARALLAALGEGWDAAVAAAQSITHDRLGAVRGYEDKAFQEYIKGLRDEWKDACAVFKPACWPWTEGPNRPTGRWSRLR